MPVKIYIMRFGYSYTHKLQLKDEFLPVNAIKYNHGN